MWFLHYGDHSGGAPWIWSDGNDCRFFLHLKFSIPGFFRVGKNFLGSSKQFEASW